MESKYQVSSQFLADYVNKRLPVSRRSAILLEVFVSGTPPFEKLKWGHAESRRDPADVLEADIALAAFDPPDVTPIEAQLQRKLLLAPAASLAQVTHASTEECFDVGLIHISKF